MSRNFALLGPAMAENPYPLFAMLRGASPVTRVGEAGLWAVARHEDVVRILRDPDTFSSMVSAQALAGDEVPPSMIFNDPPVHTRLRGLISKAFTPRVVELQRPAIQEYCDDLVGKMLEKDHADIVAELAYPLPVMVIANMLGVADGDMATFKRWSDDIIENLGAALILGDDSGMADTNTEFDAYFKVRLDKLRAMPDDTLLSGLVYAETDEGRLSEEDLLMFCRLLLVAGNETTTGLIVNAMRAFSEFPEAMIRVRAEPSLVAPALEEALRYYAPFAATIRRTTREVEVAGVTIPAGQRLLVLLASADRDDAVFERPDEFVVDREPNRHVSFGMGIHYCVGAPLARLEASIALRTLLPRISRVEVEAAEPGTLLRPGGPKSLGVRFERVAAVG